MVARYHYHSLQKTTLIYKTQIIEVSIIDYFVTINIVIIPASYEKEGLWQPQIVKIRSMT